MPRYKRTRDEAELDVSFQEDEMPPQQMETLTKLRGMWEFASFMQYIFLFGHVVRIDDDFDIEDLEEECLQAGSSDKLAHIGLQLLKYVSSHRGLTPDIFDEYTRRQYVAKAPSRNPYGEEEEPAKFNDFDIYTKIRVLQQLSTWTLGNADRIRGMMPPDEDHLNWRMEPLGWDKEDRAYFVLDDNRLYRRADEPPPPPTPKPKAKSKAKSKSSSKATRASKRRKIEDTEDEQADEDTELGAQDDTVMTNGEAVESEPEPGFGFTSKTWDCIAITLDEYNDFLAGIFRTRDANEKQLRKRIEDDVLPIIEKRAEALRQKVLKKQREFENLQKMATAKRSSRLQDKAEKEKQEREEREVEEKKQRDLRMAHEEQERQRRIEEGHESRRLTREQRLKEREVKRILHEEELARIEEQANRAVSQDPASDEAAAAAVDGSKRMSERQLKTQKEQHKKELEKLAQEEDNWVFDCSVCGVHGENLDDGTHSIACEKCNVWQHSKCHGFLPKQAEKDGFHFICSTCKRKEADAKKPKIPPLKLGKPRMSNSPESQKTPSRPTTANGSSANALPDHVRRQLDGVHAYAPSKQSPGPFGSLVNGPNLSPYAPGQEPLDYRSYSSGRFANRLPPPSPQHPWQGSPLPPPARPAVSGPAGSPPPIANGYGSPHYQQHLYAHQNAHQNAMASAGAHPRYQNPPYHPQQQNGYSPGPPAGPYAMSPPPPQHQQYYQPPPAHLQYQQAYPPPPQQPGMGQMVGGQQSPVKNGASPSPPQHTVGPAHLYGSQSHQLPQHSQTFGSNANFPPPLHAQHIARSPVKGSPSQGHQPNQPRPSQPAPSPVQTSQNYPRPPTNGSRANPNQHATGPAQMHHSTPANPHANGVAADGMSGPWPEGSKAIPQKHDQSPARPSSSQGAGEIKVMPPVAPLAPSPGQLASPTGPQSVPVKKAMDVNSTRGPVPAHERVEAAMQMSPTLVPVPAYGSKEVNGTAKEPSASPLAPQ